MIRNLKKQNTDFVVCSWWAELSWAELSRARRSWGTYTHSLGNLFSELGLAERKDATLFGAVGSPGDEGLGDVVGKDLCQCIQEVSFFHIQLEFHSVGGDVCSQNCLKNFVWTLVLYPLNPCFNPQFEWIWKVSKDLQHAFRSVHNWRLFHETGYQSKPWGETPLSSSSSNWGEEKKN